MRTPILGIALVFSAASQTFPVAGVVTDAIRNAPLERVRVLLTGGRGGPLAVTTAADGRFHFDVPLGKYALYADRNGWRILFGNPEPSVGFGSAVITGPGQDTGHLIFRWYAPGAIFGRVTDEGEPVRDATVQLIRDSVVSGRRRIVAAGSTKTDDRGAYRFGPLAAGSYYIVVTGRPWYAEANPSPIIRFGNSDELSELAKVYPATYYPGSTDIGGATPITLKSAAEVRADIPLQAVAASTVRFRCPGLGTPNDSCQGRPSFYMNGIGGVEILQPTDRLGMTGETSRVPPGRYTIRFPGAGTARGTIDVGAGEVIVNLTMEQDSLITGQVTFLAPLRPGASAYVGMANETTGQAYGIPIAADGTFQFHRVGGARFRPNLYGSAGLFIAQMSADGTPLKDGVLDLTENTTVHLNILASDETGRLKGFAMNGDTPAPAALVVLAPLTASTNPTDYRGYQTESDGSFDYTSVPAGDYLVFAADKLDLEYTNPEAIRPYLPAAATVHIAAHGVVEQRVALPAK